MTYFNEVTFTTVAFGEDDCEVTPCNHPSTLILATCWHSFRNQREALLDCSDIKAWFLSQWHGQDTQSGRLLRTLAAHQIITSPAKSSDLCNLFWNALKSWE